MAVSQAEGGTRSGLLWEVERILTELHTHTIKHSTTSIANGKCARSYWCWKRSTFQ